MPQKNYRDRKSTKSRPSLVDNISKGNGLHQNNEFVLSPQAYSFCVNEFINSVEILGNKIVSMDFLTSSKRIPMYYATISTSIVYVNLYKKSEIFCKFGTKYQQNT
ncbi:hypothetical protein RCL_jg8801.t1 [Rhizophagus clarus]|uniref:Uncharacterized protein n=1 Tax=Rhizophagus clarus TaxID=94130 RepID=A0A8H3QZV8_9GLOM|nr:hypothetical protein RCL_jg8801.t1 [Rhizophagus clarus]